MKKIIDHKKESGYDYMQTQLANLRASSFQEHDD
jgi:hypothetical protein